ncbi:MAG: hypothetical protein H0U65_12230 [Rubrobacter sp.]|jgi:hypothetical protein|nr:hypothetical protein [Rubrobacter sp.]
MKRLLAITVFLAAMLALSACGGAGQSSGQSGEEAAPPEPTQAEAPANGGDADAPEEANGEEGAAPSDETSDEASEDASSEASGPTATTIAGEEVSLGGEDVTALFFMAGW